MKKINYFLLTKTLGLYLNILSFVAPNKALRLSYKFFSQPRAGKLLKNQLPAILQNIPSEKFHVNDYDFEAYIWPGNETTILLVHGWESNASRWENLLPHLQKTGCTIIAIDAPAHGLSSGKEFNVPTYAQFIDTVSKHFSAQYLIGHSLGGATCVYYQHHYQNPNIKKIILLGAPSDLKILIKNFAQLLSLNNRIVQLLEQHFLERFEIKVSEFSSKVFGKTIKIQGLIAHDLEDPVVKIDEAHKIAEAWSHAKFIKTKGLGHSMHDEKLYQKIADFITETEY